MNYHNGDLERELRKLKQQTKPQKVTHKTVEVKKTISTTSAIYVFLAIVLVFVNDQISQMEIPLWIKAAVFGGIALTLAILGIQTIPVQTLLEILKKNISPEQKLQELEVLLRQVVGAWVNEVNASTPPEPAKKAEDPPKPTSP